MSLYDNHGRIINYLRLAVTDRCNLRCFYCMPEEGIKYVPQDDLLTYEEMMRLVVLLAEMGVSKVRITGGEPFVRKDMIHFLHALCETPGIQAVHITTNGTMTSHIVSDLKSMGIRSINLSLDTLDKQRFFEITRRDVFDQVMETFHAVLEAGIPLKINCVVMDGRNTDDILPLVALAEKYPVGVRFIEEMPFNGTGERQQTFVWNHKEILSVIQHEHPEIKKIPDPMFSTSMNYQIPGFKGTIGIIAAYSRTFCGTCNRLRVTPTGTLKTCLYDAGVFNVKDLMRKGATDTQLRFALHEALRHRAKDGWEAESQLRSSAVHESMATIGG
jgi:cyclic pyranopterin phosphate synthase